MAYDEIKAKINSDFTQPLNAQLDAHMATVNGNVGNIIATLDSGLVKRSSEFSPYVLDDNIDYNGNKFFLRDGATAGVALLQANTPGLVDFEKVVTEMTTDTAAGTSVGAYLVGQEESVYLDPELELLTISAALSGGDFAGYPKANAFDGSDSTYWQCSQTTAWTASATLAWLGADFGVAVEVDYVAIKCPDYNSMVDTQVWYSDNGSTWTVASFAPSYVWLKNVLDGSNKRNFIPVAKERGAHRYWRVSAGSTPTSGTAWKLTELKFYRVKIDSLGSFPLCKYKNINKQVVASTLYGEYYSASSTLLLDDFVGHQGLYMPSTAMTSSSTAYLDMEFNEPVSIDKVEIYSMDGYYQQNLDALEVLYSDNGSSWTHGEMLSKYYHEYGQDLRNLIDGTGYSDGVQNACGRVVFPIIFAMKQSMEKHKYWRVTLRSASEAFYWAGIKLFEKEKLLDNIENSVLLSESKILNVYGSYFYPRNEIIRSVASQSSAQITLNTALDVLSRKELIHLGVKLGFSLFRRIATLTQGDNAITADLSERIDANILMSLARPLLTDTTPTFKARSHYEGTAIVPTHKSIQRVEYIYTGDASGMQISGLVPINPINPFKTTLMLVGDAANGSLYSFKLRRKGFIPYVSGVTGAEIVEGW